MSFRVVCDTCGRAETPSNDDPRPGGGRLPEGWLQKQPDPPRGMPPAQWQSPSNFMCNASVHQCPACARPQLTREETAALIREAVTSALRGATPSPGVIPPTSVQRMPDGRLSPRCTCVVTPPFTQAQRFNVGAHHAARCPLYEEDTPS